MNGAVVRKRAMQLYNHKAETRGEESGSFHASKEWFENFKKQRSLYNPKRI
jgi:hypothetical protein